MLTTRRNTVLTESLKYILISLPKKKKNMFGNMFYRKGFKLDNFTCNNLHIQFIK